MKLLYSPASPFARKVRAAAIELCLSDRLERRPSFQQTRPVNSPGVGGQPAPAAKQ